MCELTKGNDKSSLIGLLHGQGGGLVIPQPYERDIFLFDTHVAGTTHIEGIEELEPKLLLDERLSFFREPDNAYDKQAIVIKTVAGTKIGYVPKQDNAIFARLMDAGKLLFGRISSKEKKGNWVKIGIKVFLHE
ncbi:MAG: restriction endonuclease [Ruminococcaceae bacterium]|nr:restriction endonuclease [Oscillospiraceae bacterium]